MFKRKQNLNKDKTYIMEVGYPLQMRTIDLHSNLKLDQTGINLSTRLRNLFVLFDENFSLKHQIAAVKKSFSRSDKHHKSYEVYR